MWLSGSSSWCKSALSLQWCSWNSTASQFSNTSQLRASPVKKLFQWDELPELLLRQPHSATAGASESCRQKKAGQKGHSPSLNLFRPLQPLPEAAALILVSGKWASACRNYFDSKFVFVRGPCELQLSYFEINMFNLPGTEGKHKIKEKEKREKCIKYYNGPFHGYNS